MEKLNSEKNIMDSNIKKESKRQPVDLDVLFADYLGDYRVGEYWNDTELYGEEII